MKRQSKILWSFVVLSGLACGIAEAQYTNPHTGTNWNNPMSSFLDTVLLNNMQTQQLMTSQMIARNALQRSLKRNYSTPRRSQREQKAIDRFAKYRGTMFKAAKPLMPARLAARFVPQPGQQRDNMTLFFSKLLEVYEIRSKQQKAPANDLARTLAYCIAANYAYHTEQDVSAAGLVTLRGKIRGALLGEPKFRTLSDSKKQELSETLIILTHFVAVGYDESKKEGAKDAMQAFKRLAGLNLQGMLGVAPQRVRLEKTGLVIAG